MSAQQHATTCGFLVRNGACTCAPTRVALHLKARAYQLCLWCPTCRRTAHNWRPGDSVSVAEVAVAEQQHVTAFHTPAPDFEVAN